MVRIEMKEIAPGKIAIGMEADKATMVDIIDCAAHGFVAVIRKMVGGASTDPEFASEVAKLIEEMLKDEGSARVTPEVEGKEARLMAALYGMNPGEKG